MSFKKIVLLVFMMGLLLVPAGCKTAETDNNKTPKPSPTKPTVQNADVAVYYPKMTDTETYLVREVHTLKKTSDMPKTAVEELIKGKTTTKGAYKVIPSSTKVLSVKVDKQGLATVDFSPEVLQANVGASGEAVGITSIVNTLTEFSNIKKVQFTVNGQVKNAIDWWGHVGLSEQPFSRDLSVVNEPAIWVTKPTADQTVNSPLKITGSARVFEAVVSYRIRDSAGNVLAQGSTNASAGAPGRGDFSCDVAFKTDHTGKGQIEVFEASPKDGSDINKVIIPVKLK